MEDNRIKPSSEKSSQNSAQNFNSQAGRNQNREGLNVPQKLGQAVVEEQKFQTDLKQQQKDKLNQRYEARRVTTPSFGEIVNKEDKEYPNIQRVRTFKDDIAQAVETNQLSAVKIAMAEQQKRQSLGIQDSTSISRKQKKPWGTMQWVTFIVVIFIFLLGGAVGFVYLQRSQSQQDVVPQQTTYEHFLYSDGIKEITISTDDDRNSFIKKIDADKENLDEGKIKLYEIKNNGSIIDPGQFFLLLQSGAPSELQRSLNPVFELGTYYSDKPVRFIIMKTSSYDIAYAAMLDWEKYIGEDLNHVLYNEPSLDATSTNTKIPEFQDGLMYNKDVRYLNNEDGNLIFFYSFVDPKTIVISSDQNALKEIIDRLTIKRIKR